MVGRLDRGLGIGFRGRHQGGNGFVLLWEIVVGGGILLVLFLEGLELFEQSGEGALEAGFVAVEAGEGVVGVFVVEEAVGEDLGGGDGDDGKGFGRGVGAAIGLGAVAVGGEGGVVLF